MCTSGSLQGSKANEADLEPPSAKLRESPSVNSLVPEAASETPAGDVQSEPKPSEKNKATHEESPSLDDLLRQARGGDVASHEITLRRLEDREAVGQAVKSTLQVAYEIAAYGDAGVNLMHDASLEQVVESLVQQRQKSRTETIQAVATQKRIQPIVEPHSVAADNEGFPAFDAVFLQRKPQPLRVGLKRRENGEFIVLYAGQSTRLDGDTVRLLRITEDHGVHVLVFDVNGQERRAYVR